MAEQFEKDRKIFLESFPGMKCYQTFDDNAERKSRKLIWQRSSDGDSYPIDGEIDFTKKQIPAKIIQDIEARNEYGACCSLTINETDGNGRTRQNMKRVRSLFGDFDDPDAVLPIFDIKPSMAVESSPNKFHVYFFTTPEQEEYNVPLVSFKSLQESIAAKYNTDESMKDITKAVRMPGFYHCKGERFLSRIIEYTGKRYSFGELVDAFPPLPVKQWSASKYQTPVGGYDSEFKGSRGVGAGGRNCHLIKVLGGAKKRGLTWNQLEQEAYLEGSCCSPPMKESEIRDVLKSFSRY